MGTGLGDRTDAMLAETIRERQASHTIGALADAIAVEVAACPQVWEWGDGKGGWLIERVTGAVLERLG